MMFGNLSTRIEKLEAKAGAKSDQSLRMVKLCFTEGDVDAAYKEAERHAIRREEVQIIMLVPLESRPATATAMS